MKDFATDNNIKTTTRRMLVGGMKAQKILLATPLLKWYVEHGMVVTRVYQGVEYTAKPCFSEFANTVTNSRRDGDADPTKAILADTSKLIGMCFLIFLRTKIFLKISYTILSLPFQFIKLFSFSRK